MERTIDIIWKTFTALCIATVLWLVSTFHNLAVKTAVLEERLLVCKDCSETQAHNTKIIESLLKRVNKITEQQ